MTDTSNTETPTTTKELPVGESNDSADFSELLAEPQDSAQEDSVTQEAAADTQTSEKPVATPVATPVPAQPAQAPASTTQPPVMAPQPAQTPAPVPTPAAAAPAATPQPAAAPAEATKPIDLVSLRQNTINELASTYVFSDADVQQLHDEPEKVLPRLAAQVTVNAYEAVSRTVMAHLPALVATITQGFSTQQKVENDFFAAYPKLAKPEYRETLSKVGASFRQLNPKASTEEAMKFIAAQTAIMLGIPDPHTPEGGNASPQPLAANSQSVQQPGFSPAVPGATAAQRPAAGNDPWANLVKEFEELDNA